MREETSVNMWSFLGRADVICVTTNGALNGSGNAVMGRGTARQAANRWPGIESILARHLTNSGNVPGYLGTVDKFGRMLELMSSEEIEKMTRRAGNGLFRTAIWSFPTKNQWRDPSDIRLIRRSASTLKMLATTNSWRLIVIPRPGCGCGMLQWDRDLNGNSGHGVRSTLQDLLDDRFLIVHSPDVAVHTAEPEER